MLRGYPHSHLTLLLPLLLHLLLPSSLCVHPPTPSALSLPSLCSSFPPPPRLNGHLLSRSLPPLQRHVTWTWASPPHLHPLPPHSLLPLSLSPPPSALPLSRPLLPPSPPRLPSPCPPLGSSPLPLR